MIHRPNTTARCFQHNLRARHPHNRRFWSRHFKLYVHKPRCRWCQRWYPGDYSAIYPCLCYGCARYLHEMEPIPRTWGRIESLTLAEADALAEQE